jgi:hypothetical protein
MRADAGRSVTGPADPFADDPANRYSLLYRQLIEQATIDDTRRAIDGLDENDVRSLLMVAMWRENLRHEDPTKFHRWNGTDAADS